ncbi:hypothetical protein [Corallococcus sp. Z5C101001]|uniref:hypothetical protein n=2 Tax=Corallococcus TaxID=83461 RepID=UPI001180AE52|nr:hypothetical protein [Corallococcus sp. Z5C101001]TSC25195.1 hypothetical protein FOF48_25005 [Corallococcus sp. Z5C101001]
MSRLSLTLAASVALCFTAGCSKKGMYKSDSGQSAPPSGQSTAMTSQGNPRCPMSVPGTQVSTQTTSDGVALIFSTTDPSQVSDLQSRTRRMLDAQSKSTNAETPMDLAKEEDLGDSAVEEQAGRDESGTGGAGYKAKAGAPTVPSKAEAQDTPEGITIIYSAQDQMQKRQLVDEVNATAHQMKNGHCPGM